MKKHTIITIGRQFGSGGHEVGKGLASQLEIPCYDKELIVAAAKKSGLNENLFKNVDERATNSILYSLVLGSYAPTNGMTGMPPLSMNETLFQIQSEVIKDMAEEGSCVIVGRCADYILRDMPNVVNIFIHAGMDYRTAHVRREHLEDKGMSPEKLEDYILKTDKKRANFYNYYSGQRWGDAKNYHLSIDSGKLGIEKSILVIKQFIELSQE